MPPLAAAAKPTDIHIEEVTCAYEDFLYRTPIKFGGVALDRVTLVGNGDAASTALSVAVAGGALFAVGASKARATVGSVAREGATLMAIGLATAALAWGVGRLLKVD